jgi:drug/metabolite transporter (DMT)-like permease
VSNFFKSGPMIAFYSAILFGFTLVFLDTASKAVGPFKLISYYQLAGVALLFVFSIITKKKLQVKKLIKNNKRELLEIFLLRSMGGSVLYTYGFFLTTAIKGSFFTRFEAMFVVVMGYLFLKEKISKRDLFAILAMVIGAIVLATGGDFSTLVGINLGDIMIVGGGLLLSYTFVSAKRIKNVDPISITFLTMLLGGTAMLLLLPILNGSFGIGGLDNALQILGVTFFTTSGMLLFYKALEKTKAWVVGAILSIQTVVAAIISYLFLNQTLTTIQTAGALVVLVMSVYVTYRSAENDAGLKGKNTQK